MWSRAERGMKVVLVAVDCVVSMSQDIKGSCWKEENGGESRIMEVRDEEGQRETIGYSLDWLGREARKEAKEKYR